MSDDLLGIVRADTEVRLKKEEFNWKDSRWTQFIKEVATWLLEVKEEPDDVTATVMGLIKYRATNVKKLIAIANTKERFATRLSAKGVPDAICDALFDKYVAPVQSTELPSIEKVCDAYIQDNVKLEKLPELEYFEVPEGSPFQTFARKDVKVPKMPDKAGKYKDWPYMLFHGLSELEVKEVEEKEAEKKEAGVKTMYQYISENSPHGPTAIYATSGAGKTRGAFEYLCCNWGFYFTFFGSIVNPGSGDMDHVLGYLRNVKRSSLEGILKDEDEKYRRGKNEGNRDIVRQVLSCVFYVRWRVLKVLRDLFQETFKPYHWLLIQLHPKQFFDGHDIFYEMIEEITSSCAATTLGDRALRKLLKTEKDEVQVFPLFVDETQMLCKEMKEGYFISSNSADTWRSAYSAFLVAFTGISSSFSTKIGYPIMMGTGLSYSSIKEESGSFMLKASSSEYKNLFFELPKLDHEAVKGYMQKFANFAGVDRNVVTHTTKWLIGRPRWSASFLMSWMSNSFKTNSSGKETLDTLLLKEIDTFVAKMGQASESTNDTWFLSKYTPLQAMKKLRRAPGKTDGHIESYFIKTVMRSWLGQPQLVGTLNTALDNKLLGRLVELGIAQCTSVSTEGTIHLSIDEPLIVETALRFYDSSIMQANSVMEAQSKSTEVGLAFEELLIFVLQEHFVKVAAEISDDYGSYIVGKSAYGVLATKCTTKKETMNWIDKALEAPLEGTVPPFCFPDNNFGPDVVFLLRDPQAWKTKFVPVLCQVKFRGQSNLNKAMCTVVPDMLYMNNRNNRTQEMKTCLTEDDQERWKRQKKKLFKNENNHHRETFEVVIQKAGVENRTIALGRVPVKSKPVLASDLNSAPSSNRHQQVPTNVQVLLAGENDLRRLFPENVVKALMQK